MPDGNGILHEQVVGQRMHITIVGAKERTIADVGWINRPEDNVGIAFSTADAHHVAFVFSLDGGAQAQSVWDLYVWNRDTHELTVVAHSPRDGTGVPLTGGWVHPELSPRYLYWIQATSDTLKIGLPAGSQLMQYDLTTRRTRMLYTGLAESIVPYRQSVLVTAVPPGTTGKSPTGPNGNPVEIVRAFNESSGTEIPAPNGITAGADGADFMRTDGDLLIWNTSLGAIRGWRALWGRSIDLVPELGAWPTALTNKPQLGYPGVPRISGHYIVWSPGAVEALDLRTNVFTQIGGERASAEAAGDYVALIQPTASFKPTGPGDGVQVSQTLINLASLPALKTCSG